MTSKVSGKFEERNILFPHIIKNADRTGALVREPDDLPSRTPELTLQRLHALGWSVKMPLKKSLENVHESVCQVDGLPTKIPPSNSFKEQPAVCPWSVAACHNRVRE